MRLKDSLIKHEGLRLKPYVDCCALSWKDCRCVDKGFLTIGCGRNLESVGVSEREAMFLLDSDMARAREDADTLPWFQKLDENRQRVVLELLFAMGLTKFHGFKKMIAALARNDYHIASAELLNSKWANQVGPRSSELVKILWSGIDPEL